MATYTAVTLNGGDGAYTLGEGNDGNAHQELDKHDPHLVKGPRPLIALVCQKGGCHVHTESVP